MIVFCEDCGGKNTPGPDKVAGDMVQYRCALCNYLNTCPAPRRQEPPGENRRRPGTDASDAIRGAFAGLRALPGVVGALLYHESGDILLNLMERGPGEAELGAISDILARNFREGSGVFDDVDEVALILSKTAVVVRNVPGGLFIVAICNTYPMNERFGELMEGAARSLSHVAGLSGGAVSGGAGMGGEI